MWNGLMACAAQRGVCLFVQDGRLTAFDTSMTLRENANFR